MSSLHQPIALYCIVIFQLKLNVDISSSYETWFQSQNASPRQGLKLDNAQNYFMSSEHRISEPTIKQFRNLKGAYSLCNKLLESVA